MNKKLIAAVLAVVVLLALLLTQCFGSGGQADQPAPQTDPTETTVSVNPEDLANAIEYLRMLYKDVPEKTPADYDRVGVLRVGGQEYTVVWTVDVDEDLVKIIVNDDGTVTFQVATDLEEEVPYVLTATITDAAGNSQSISWNHVIPGIMDEEMMAIVDMAYALEDGESLPEEQTLTGVITSVDTMWSDQYKNITVTMAVAGREDKPIKCYRLKGEGAEDLAVGDTITVFGILKNYKGTIEFDAGCQLIAVKKGDGEAVKAPTDPLEIMKEAYALKSGQSLPYQPTLTGTITSVDESYSSQYQNITVTIKVDGAPGYSIKCYRLKGEGADTLNVNDIITVTGAITNYQGTIEFNYPTLVSVTQKEPPKQPSDPKAVVDAAYKLDPGSSLPYTATLTGKVTQIVYAYSAEYGNVCVNMVVEGRENKPIYCFAMVGSYSDMVNIEVGDTITVRGIIKNYVNTETGKSTIEYDRGCELLKLVKAPKVDAPDDPLQIVDDAYNLGTGDALNYTATLTGKITKINTPYSSQYKNISVTIEVEGRESKPILCYRLKGTGADGLEVGDTITVTGKLINYNGTVEFTQGCTLDKVVKGEGTDDTEPTEPTGPVDSTLAETVTANTAYKFGMVQGNLENKVYYLAGGMDGYYMATTANAADAIDVYLEETDGGYYFYTLNGETKSYINMVVSGTHVNGAYGDTASTVYTLDETNKTVIATIDGAPYWFGTRNDKTYTTMGPCKTEYDGFFGQFYTTSGESTDPTDPTETEPTVPSEPEESELIVAETVTANTAYKFGMVQGNLENKVYYLAGGMNGYYMATTEDVEAAIDVYLEETDGGYYFYTLNGDTKTYINMVVSGTHVNGAYEAAASTVYTWDDTNKTVIATVDGAPYWFGTRNDKTYTTMGPCKTEYDGFFGQFYTTSGESTDPTDPTDPTETEPTTPSESTAPADPEADSKLTIVEALELGASKEHNTYTTDKYYVTGVITEVYNTTYGNMKITDEAGNILTVYGTYSADGSIRYDAMDVQPVAGDTVTVYGIIGQYNGTAQIKNGWITEHIPAETEPTDPSDPSEPTETEPSESTAPADPEADSKLTIVEALELGASKDHNTYTTGKYYVTGVITEVYNTTYGNMKITDEAGNILTVYGTYSADGSTRYDAMDVQPVAGDTVTVYGIIGQYNGTAQIKNGWITEHIPAETEPEVVIDGPYKYYVEQNNLNKTLYFNGAMSGYYLGTTENVDEAVDVYTETTADGTRLYFMNGDTKTYIEVIANGSYVNAKLNTEPSMYFTFSEEVNTYVADINGTDYYVGTYNTYSTLSPSKTTFITGNNAANVGVTQFIAQLGNPSEEEVPTDPTETEPTETEPAGPEADSTLSIADAIALGTSKDHNTYTTDKYYVTGVITEVYNTTYGNMKITDEAGNILTVYGTYSADGSTRYDAMDVQPVAGDTVTVYGIIGQYNGTAQVKNGWITEHIPAETEPTTDPDVVAAEAVITKIEAIGEVTVDSKTAIEEARTAYDALTDAQKALVTNYETLTTAEAAYEELTKEPEVSAANEADFDTITTSNANGDSSYTKTYTTTNGWTTTNCAIQTGTSGSAMNPQYPVIGPDNTHKAVCLNGKTSAPGKITSPTLTGGISKLTLNYTKMFTDTNLSVTITVTDLASGNTYTHVVEREEEKNTKYVIWTDEWTLETPVTGDFTIEIVNNCPTGSTSNKDRMTILDVIWESAAEPEETEPEATDPSEPTETEPSESTAPADPEADSKLTIVEALELGVSKDHNTYTTSKYYVTGVIPEVYNTQYGNMKITDEAGNILTVYGTYSADGSTRYDAMDVKPVAGDTVTVYGIIGQYNGTAQVKNGWITEHTPAEPEATDPSEPTETEPSESTAPADPEADSKLTIVEALELGVSKDHNTYTTGKYYVTGVITEVYNTQYGNMKITDEAGNILTVYGTYSADGSTRYDAMDVKPVAGDTVTVYGIIGQYNGTAQIKNGWITEHTPAETEPTETTEPETTEPAGSASSATYTMADYKVDGELGGGEASRNLDENVTFTISAGWFTTQARIYKNANGVITSQTPISSIVLNAGRKTSTFDVYTSEDGVTWTMYQEDVAYVESYSDVTINFDTPVKYIKLDAPNAQLAIAYFIITFA